MYVFVDVYRCANTCACRCVCVCVGIFTCACVGNQ